MPKVGPFQRAAFFFLVYGTLAALSLWLSYEMRFSGGAALTAADKDIEAYLFTQRPWALLWIVPLKFALLGLCGQFRGVFYYFRLHDALRMGFALALATLVILLLPFVSGQNGPTAVLGIPRSVALVDFNLSLILFVGFRVSIRTLRERFTGEAAAAPTSLERIAIVGAGNSGEQLASDLLSRRGHGLQPVCFLDDNATKHGLEIHGIPVIGAPERLPTLAEKYGVTEVILALPAQSAKRIREISALASANGLRVLVVPSMTELAGGGGEGADFTDALGALRRQSEDDFRDAVFLGEGREPFRRADHGDAVDLQAMLGGVVVQETDGLQAVAATREEVGGELFAGIAGSDDGDALERRRRGRGFARETLAQGTDGHAETDEEDQREVEVDERDAARKSQDGGGSGRAAEEGQQQDDERRQRQREAHAQRVMQAEIIEDATELTEEPQERELQRHDPQQSPGSLREEVSLDILVGRRQRGAAGETHLVAEPEGERGQGPIDEEEEGRPLERTDLGHGSALGHGAGFN
jgi:hypothetical protein